MHRHTRHTLTPLPLILNPTPQTLNPQVVAMERAVVEHQALLHRLELERAAAKDRDDALAVVPPQPPEVDEAPMDASAFAAQVEARVTSALQEHARVEYARQELTLVHVRAQLEQLQDIFMSQAGLYDGRKSSS